MEIILENISKRFVKSYVIKNQSYNFVAGKVYGICGANGSGKSTLLKIISGAMIPSVGTVRFQHRGQTIPEEKVFSYLSYYASGDTLIEEYSPREIYNYVSKFKSYSVDFHAFIRFVELENKADETIDTFSSGMKQRLSLGLLLLSDSPILLFDEPVTFLDEARKSWFYRHLKKLKEKKEKLIIIASNEAADFILCDEVISV